MKPSVSSRVKLFMPAVACYAMVLCSCQPALHVAAASGDVEVVRQALSKGVTPQELNEASETAYINGQIKVLDELAKAGAAVAPEYMAGKTIVLKDTFQSNMDECKECDESFDLGTTDIWPYWNYHAAMQRYEHDAVTEMQWTGANVYESRTTTQKTEAIAKRSYVRMDVAKARITHAEHYRSERRARQCTDKVELEFETPTSGKYTRLRVHERSYAIQSIGRFWLKDGALPLLQH